MNEVHVRIGQHRYVYHTDTDCPSLNGMRDTYKGQVSMDEEAAKEQELKACQRCRN